MRARCTKTSPYGDKSNEIPVWPGSASRGPASTASEGTAARDRSAAVRVWGGQRTISGERVLIRRAGIGDTEQRVANGAPLPEIKTGGTLTTGFATGC